MSQTHQSDPLRASHLPPEVLAAAQLAVERCESETPLLLAVLSGSLAMGLGHTLSDLDLYVIRADDSTERHRPFTVNSYTVHANAIDIGQVRRLVEHVNGLRVEPHDRSQLLLTTNDYKLLLRLANGTVLSGTTEHRDLFDSLDRETTRKVVILRHATMALELQEDVYGAITSGDLVTAMTASHRALLHALECGLGAVGEVYDHEKVALRRLARHPGTAHLLDQTWALLNCGLPLNASFDELAAVARRRALLTSHLIGYTLLNGWDTPTPSLPPFHVTHGGPVRHYDYGLLRFANSIALNGRDNGSRVTEAMARLWLALDGRPVDELHSSPALEGMDIPARKLHEALQKLLDSGTAAPSGEAC